MHPAQAARMTLFSQSEPCNWRLVAALDAIASGTTNPGSVPLMRRGDSHIYLLPGYRALALQPNVKRDDQAYNSGARWGIEQ